MGLGQGQAKEGTTGAAGARDTICLEPLNMFFFLLLFTSYLLNVYLGVRAMACTSPGLVLYKVTHQSRFKIPHLLETLTHAARAIFTNPRKYVITNIILTFPFMDSRSSCFSEMVRMLICKANINVIIQMLVVL